METARDRLGDRQDILETMKDGQGDMEDAFVERERQRRRLREKHLEGGRGNNDTRRDYRETVRAHTCTQNPKELT